MVNTASVFSRLLGVDSNDKTLEVIVTQGMRSVRIEDLGDTEFRSDEIAAKIRRRDGKEVARDAGGAPVLLGITKASLFTRTLRSGLFVVCREFTSSIPAASPEVLLQPQSGRPTPTGTKLVLRGVRATPPREGVQHGPELPHLPASRFLPPALGNGMPSSAAAVEATSISSPLGR